MLQLNVYNSDHEKSLDSLNDSLTLTGRNFFNKFKSFISRRVACLNSFYVATMICIKNKAASEKSTIRIRNIDFCLDVKRSHIPRLAEVHEFVECANCEGKILVRSLDLASHFRQHHNRSCLPAPDVSASSPVAGSSSAAKRQRAEAHSPVEAPCTVAVDILDLTEGEFAIPDKYSRDPLGRMEKYNFSNYLNTVAHSILKKKYWLFC
jgi:hypothetical protein